MGETEVLEKFKVLLDGEYSDRCPSVVPWVMIESHREQAFRNHGQSLEKLHRRGGLCPEELFAILQDQPFGPVERDRAVLFLLTRLRDFEPGMGSG